MKSGATLEDVSRAAGTYGVGWTTGKVSHIERGTGPLSLEDFLVLGRALSRVTGTEIEARTLIGNSDSVAVAPNWRTSGHSIASWLEGGPIGQSTEALTPRTTESESWIFPIFDIVENGPAAEHLSQSELIGRFQESMEWAGLAEARAADTLGIDTYSLAAHSVALWGHSLSIERDYRLDSWTAETGKKGSAQKKGQITRQLLAELRESIERTSRAR